MKDENVNIDKTIREKFEGFSVQPPPHIWDNLQGQIIAHKKQKRIAYFAWIATAAVVVLSFIAGWYFNDNTSIDTPFSVEEKVIQSDTKNDQDFISEEKSLNTASDLKKDNSSEGKVLFVDSDLKKETEIIDRNNTVKIETNNSIQNQQTTIIAANNLSEKLQVEADFSASSERIRLNKMESRNVLFHKKIAASNILVEMVQLERNRISNFDELIMANNVSDFNKVSKNGTGWKMGIHISPAYSSNVSNHSKSYSQNMYSDSKNGNGNVGGGVSFQYKTNKKLRIESGVYYAQNGKKTNTSIELFSRKDASYEMMYSDAENLQSNAPAMGISNAVNVSNGNMLMNSTAGVIEMNEAPKGAQIITAPEMLDARYSNTLIADGDFSQVFNFIEIPLYLRYNLLDSKFGIELMGGINAGLVVGNNAFIENSYGIQNVGKTQDISTLNFSGTVGIGANYDLGKHISLAVEPRLNYYFKSINNNPSVDFRPYRIGFYTGLYYEF